MTITLFLVATVTGVAIGVGAPELSPVAPAAAEIAGPAAGAPPATPLAIPEDIIPNNSNQDGRPEHGRNQPGAGGRR
jgi:hypothetical protein